MSVQDQAVKQAEHIRGHLQAIERRIAWGVRKAEEEGATDIRAALFIAALFAKALHKSLTFAAELIAARFEMNPGILSGGDDKPDPDPEEP